MLYCPKCRRTYNDGSQRFCTSDRARLLPALTAAGKTAEGKAGVFTSLLGKTKNSFETEESPIDSFAPAENENSAKQRSKPSSVIKFFPVDEEKIAPEIENRNSAVVEPAKPVVRLIKPSEIASGTASVGDRKANPAGRAAISWKNPDVLIGQTVKGRYQITDKIGQDESSLSFLAADKLSAEKKVVVTVLMEEDADDLTAKIFAEERVSLSHLNHPNIAALLDSGELLEGKPFIVTEYVAGKSLADKLRQTGQFNALRAARIVRQIAYALSEVHQNGSLHRNLKPENIILTVNDAGTEQVKVTDFAVSDGRQLGKNPVYKSPEQLEGRLPSFASDIYSLAVIAYQMLTNRFPFSASSPAELNGAQKQGLRVKPTNLRLDLPPLVDEILVKALAYEPSARYPKVRDFGDAFFNALTSVSPWTKTDETDTESNDEKEFSVAPPLDVVSDAALEDVEIELVEDEAEENNLISIKPQTTEKPVVEEAKTNEDLLWKNRSPEPIKVASKSWMLMSIFGLIALFFGLWAIWYYFLNRPAQPNFNAPPATNQETANAPPNTTTAPPSSDIETPPAERKVLQPANTEYFQNTRENLDGDLAIYYRGFSFFYPKDWVKTSSPKNFVDVSRKNENGLPVEQMLVVYYDSKGTFKDDSKKFSELVKESNKKLAESVPNYRFISEGENVINGGWKVYEMKFEATSATKNGEPLKLYGRRIFMPAMRPGVKSGFLITMLATSLQPEIKSADDVGVKGELQNVLATFEPTQMY